MDKAPDAFRTISEVAEVLETPAHVLRFWESRFPQIKPVKRAGGRRYYRPADVALLSGIRQLLHTDGMTIRGVQKVLREQGVRHVAALSGDISDLDLDLDADLDMPPDEMPAGPSAPLGGGTPVAPSGPVVVHLTGLPRRTAEPVPSQSAAVEPAPVSAALPASAQPMDVWPAAPDVPRDGEGGFIAFSSPRSPRPKPAADPKQPSLPFEAEAPHVWAEPDREPEATVTTLTGQPRPGSADQAPADPAPEGPVLAGVCARLRQLARPLSPQTALPLAEVHSRLGLLHAQMAEAQRLRRPAV